MDGYIALHRKIIDWEWYSDINVRITFIHLLLTANHADARWQGVDIVRGQKVTSYGSLASEVGLSVQKIRTALKKLSSTGEISIKSTNKFIILTINNYNSYQLGKSENEQKNNNQSTNKITSNQQSKNTLESIDNTTIFDSVNDDTNNQITINQQSIQQSNNNQITTNKKNNNNKNKETIYSVLDGYAKEGELREALNSFNEMRTKMKKPLTVRALKQALKLLDELSNGNYEMKIGIIDQTLQHSWQTFYALKNTYRNNNMTNEDEPDPF